MNGVCFDKQKKLFRARTTIKGKRYHVGYFRTELSGYRAIEDFTYDKTHPDKGVLKNHKLDLEAPNDYREKFQPVKWFKRELSRITRK